MYTLPASSRFHFPKAPTPNPTPTPLPEHSTPIRPNFVLDTNTILYSIASSKTDLTNENSPLDIQARKNGDPDIFRGRLLSAIRQGNILIPSIVIQELQSKLNNDELLGAENQNRLSKLLPILRTFEQSVLLPRNAYIRQNLLLSNIKACAENHIKQLASTGHSIPENWQTISPYTEKLPPEAKPLSKLIYHTTPEPATKLWHKLHNYEHITKDALYKQPTDHPDTTERALYTELLATEKALNQPNLSVTETLQLTDKSSALFVQFQNARLKAIPDFEILATAQLAQKHGPTILLTYDNDFSDIISMMPSLKVHVAQLHNLAPSMSFKTFLGEIEILKQKHKPLQDLPSPNFPITNAPLL